MRWQVTKDAAITIVVEAETYQGALAVAAPLWDKVWDEVNNTVDNLDDGRVFEDQTEAPTALPDGAALGITLFDSVRVDDESGRTVYED